jgi:hypothetical protein
LFQAGRDRIAGLKTFCAGDLPIFVHFAGPVALTIAKGPAANLRAIVARIGPMQTLLLSCLFGAVCTMVLWVVSSAAVKRDYLMRRGNRLLPPEEI